MVDFELLRRNAQKFINILFPNFSVCYNIYHDPDLDSTDFATKLIAMSFEKADYNINNFRFEKFINETNNTELYNYIKTFLPEKYKGTAELIFNTLAINILFNMRNNEAHINKNIDLFQKITTEEIDNFINLVKSFTEYNDYYFCSYNISIDDSLIGKPLTKNILIKSTKDTPIFALEKVDYNVRIYQKVVPVLIKALALIFSEKVEFFQFTDTHTMKLKSYGCKEPSLYPINDILHFSLQYHEQKFFLGSKIIINKQNYEMVHNLLDSYMYKISALDENDYKNVALEFYFDSLEKYGVAKITYSIIAIEALFNVNKQEITRAVVQRGLKILQNYFNPEHWEQIEKDLKNAYIIRSNYAHGTSRIHKDATYELSERISEYARIILLTFLFMSPTVTILRGKTGEKKYINESLIDKSLFYSQGNKQLSSILKDIPIYIKEFDKISERRSLSQGLECLLNEKLTTKDM